MPMEDLSFAHDEDEDPWSTRGLRGITIGISLTSAIRHDAVADVLSL
jgi:hypothetical protein